MRALVSGQCAEGYEVVGARWCAAPEQQERMVRALKRRVLVVDDDEEIRAALEDALEDEGYGVVASSDGEKALERLRSGERPCAILLDLWMPNMNGWELCRALEHEPELCQIPVIVLTASRETRAQELRVADVLTKPVQLEKLLAALSNLCS